MSRLGYVSWKCLEVWYNNIEDLAEKGTHTTLLDKPPVSRNQFPHHNLHKRARLSKYFPKSFGISSRNTQQFQNEDLLLSISAFIMGKARRRDRVKGRANPIGKTVKPPSDPELAAIRENKILPIITDLTSPESKKRSSAAIAIANIIEDTKCRKLLLREQIIRILLEQTITDSALESKSAGWGILRNLAIEEEADFCIYLYRQDILTAIQGTAQNVSDMRGHQSDLENDAN